MEQGGSITPDAIHGKLLCSRWETESEEPVWVHVEGGAKVRVAAASAPCPCLATFLTLSWAGESRSPEKMDKEDQ